jgi:hypothetical protein
MRDEGSKRPHAKSEAQVPSDTGSSTSSLLPVFRPHGGLPTLHLPCLPLPNTGRGRHGEGDDGQLAHGSHHILQER